MNRIVLFSGGMDSTVLAYQVLYNYCAEGDNLILATIDIDTPEIYAQIKSQQYFIKDLRCIGKEQGINVCSFVLKLPNIRVKEWKDRDKDYVPFRNTLFIFQVLHELYDGKTPTRIYTGFILPNRLGFNDISQNFVDSVNDLIYTQTGNEHDILLVAPFVNLTKNEIVAIGRSLLVDLEKTWSCNFPIELPDRYEPCGECQDCKSREALGIKCNIWQKNS